MSSEEEGHHVTVAILAGGREDAPPLKVVGPDVVIDRSAGSDAEVERVVNKITKLCETQIRQQHTAYAAEWRYFYVPLMARITADNSLETEIYDKGYETREQLLEAVRAFLQHCVGDFLVLDPEKYATHIWDHRDDDGIQVLVVSKKEEDGGVRLQCMATSIDK